MSNLSIEEKIDHYINTYEGGRLLKEHSLSEKDLWMVYGEDPNCDLHGHHHNPILGTFSGELELVIKKAVELKGFYTWGGGGVIRKLIVEELI